MIKFLKTLAESLVKVLVLYLAPTFALGWILAMFSKKMRRRIVLLIAMSMIAFPFYAMMPINIMSEVFFGLQYSMFDYWLEMFLTLLSITAGILTSRFYNTHPRKDLPVFGTTRPILTHLKKKYLYSAICICIVASSTIYAKHSLFLPTVTGARTMQLMMAASEAQKAEIDSKIRELINNRP
jgi:hypothetical protein